MIINYFIIMELFKHNFNQYFITAIYKYSIEVIFLLLNYTLNKIFLKTQIICFLSIIDL
jgi:hypothetical protein